MPAKGKIERYKPCLVEDFGQSSGTHNADRNKDGSDQAQQDAVGSKTCCLYFVYVLRTYNKLRSRVLHCFIWVRKHSKIQTVTYVLLIAFSKMYLKNKEKR